MEQKEKREKTATDRPTGISNLCEPCFFLALVISIQLRKKTWSFSIEMPTIIDRDLVNKVKIKKSRDRKRNETRPSHTCTRE